MMKLGEKRDIKPLLVKFGVAFVFSLAGFFISRHRTKKAKPALPPCPPRLSGLSFSLYSVFSCIDFYLGFVFLYLILIA